jgi:inward rectifier potassium channel
MFRFANARTNVLSDITIQWMASWNKAENGKVIRRFIRLPLERERVDFLTLSWTVVHPLDEVSPMAGMTKEDIIAADTEFIIILKAYDETFAQNIIYRHSYKYHELVWNASFIPTFHRSETGASTILELDRIGDFQIVDKTGKPCPKPDVIDLINEAEKPQKRAEAQQKG